MNIHELSPIVGLSLRQRTNKWNKKY